MSKYILSTSHLATPQNRKYIWFQESTLFRQLNIRKENNQNQNKNKNDQTKITPKLFAICTLNSKTYDMETACNRFPDYKCMHLFHLLNNRVFSNNPTKYPCTLLIFNVILLSTCALISAQHSAQSWHNRSRYI